MTGPVEWQSFALAHPLNRANDVALLRQLTHDQVLPGGNVLRVILSIDR